MGASRQITLRNVSPDLARRLKALAEERASSVNSVALEILEEAVGIDARRKHLVDLFNREVGLPPKTLARVHRFRKALLASRSSASPAWSEIAVACGYYDQAHLIHDFQQFAGVPPAAFSRLAMPDPASIVVR